MGDQAVTEAEPYLLEDLGRGAIIDIVVRPRRGEGTIPEVGPGLDLLEDVAIDHEVHLTIVEKLKIRGKSQDCLYHQVLRK